MFFLASHTNQEPMTMTRLTKAFIKSRKNQDEPKEIDHNDVDLKIVPDDVVNTVNMFIDTLDNKEITVDNTSAPVAVADATQPPEEAINMNMKEIEDARRAFMEAQAKANEMQEKLKELQQAEKINILARIKDEIKDLGITYEDLKDVIQATFIDALSAPGAKRTRRTKEEMAAAKGEAGSNDGRAKVAPKYRNPNDIFQTWTGRGKQPSFVKEALAAGKTLEDLLIERD